MIEFFTDAYSNVPMKFIVLEMVAFVFGIISVWYARNENILVYPTGLICTIITTYLLYNAQYFGDMCMNVYYSIMSIYGWVLWSKKKGNEYVEKVSYLTRSEKLIGILLFFMTIGITYGVYKWLKPDFDFLNIIDIYTSGLFFTAMWFMAKKKIESWILWIVADAITIPLYAVRGLGMLSLQYLIFLILAISGYIAWIKIYKSQTQSNKIDQIGL